MLRWLQSTVQISGGYGVTTFRMHVTQKSSFKCISSLGYIKSKSSLVAGRADASPDTSKNSTPVPLQNSTVLGGDVNHASNERVRDFKTLRHYLTSKPTNKLSPGALVSLYESVRASSQLKLFNATQLSNLISILGASSLPPDAPRIRREHVDDIPNTSSYWSHVLCVAADKKALGFLLNDGDHYWAMWAWLSRYRSNECVNALAKASIHYRRIWRKTQFPDILVPYLEALLSSGSSEYLNTAVADICGILSLHSNLHGRSLKLVWALFLSFPDALVPSMKNDILDALWNRTAMSNTIVRRSNYMATHRFNPLTKRHECLPLGIAHLIASLGTPLFSLFLVSVPLSVQQWARRQLKIALSPSCSDEIRWMNFSLFALNQAARNGISGVPTLDPNGVGPHFNDWHVVLTLSILENVIDHMILSQGSEVRSILAALWEKWVRVEDDRPTFVSRAVISSFLQLAARTQDTYILDQCHRYSLNNALWELNPNHTAADGAQIDALVGHYLEGFIRCHGRNWADILNFLDAQKGLSVPGTHADFVIQKFLPLDIGIARDFYDFCISHDVPVGADITTMLAITLAPTRIHDVFPMLEHGLDHVQTEKVLLVLLDTLRTQRYQYLTPASGRILGCALCKLLQSKPPVARIKYPLRYSLLRLVVSNCAADAIRIVELVNERAPSFLDSRFIQRLLGIFLRHRQYTFTGRLYRIMKSRSVSSLDRFRRKLIFGLIRGGASAFARRFRSPRSARLTLQKMMSVVEYQGSIPCRKTSDRVLSIIRKDPSDILSIKHAFSTLVLSNRPVLAKHLFRSSLPYLDPLSKIWLGNVFLHRILRRFDKRNIQVVKKLLRAKSYLTTNFGFTGDRITFNILMKGMLRWKKVSSPRTRMLFDDCVRMGYPVGSRWRMVNDVPFGTRSHLSPVTFGISTLDPHISFHHHVRPLYKMFIKAFYLRKDIEAAKAVVGILKNEEAETLSKQQYRDHSRLEGLRKAKIEKRKRK